MARLRALKALLPAYIPFLFDYEDGMMNTPKAELSVVIVVSPFMSLMVN